jgi:hypothetical protein
MGMKSYGFIPIRFYWIESPPDRIGGLQDDFFAIFTLISTGGVLFVIPMEMGLMAASPVDFRARIDDNIGVFFGEFNNFHSFSVA